MTIDNVYEMKQMTRFAILREIYEKSKNCAFIWDEIAPGQYHTQVNEFDFILTNPYYETWILDIHREETLYRTFSSNFFPEVKEIYKEVDYFIMNEMIKKHRTLNNVLGNSLEVVEYEDETGGGTKLFDATSWASIVPEPYRSYLNMGKRRWETYVGYREDVITGIKSLDPTWNGLRLFSYNEFNDSSVGTIASCGVYEYLDIDGGSNDYRFNSLSFVLNINKHFESYYTPNDWINIITHELGHALGIGIFWQSYFVSQGAIPPSNDFLSSAYQNTLNAYNEITNLNRDRVPLEATGGSGTASAHWENDYRPASAPGAASVDYLGLYDEVMIGYYAAGMNLVVSNLSIDHLLDLGYKRKSGFSEGEVTTVGGTSFKQDTSIKLNCNCNTDFSKMKKVGTINIKK